MINTTFYQVIIKINGKADIELHCDGKTIFAYSYTLGRNFENWEIADGWKIPITQKNWTGFWNRSQDYLSLVSERGHSLF